MKHPISIWTLKKQPLAEVAAYIIGNGTPQFQARMADMPLAAYTALPEDEQQERLIQAIASMPDEDYSDYLLELIDE